MPFFVHPNLFWTLGLPTLGVVAIPVLIHLINMMRHRRVEWAAMEFLLVSQKKNRTWIMLKQLLLLLLRMAAVAMVVLVAAQPLLRNQWTSLLGGARTHHIVLLDDSYSMSDHWADTDAFTEAKKAVARFGAEAARQVEPQAFTLLRFSEVRQSQRGTQPDLLKQAVGADFVSTLDNTLANIKVTQTAVGPIAALRAIGQLLGTADSERRDRLHRLRFPRPRVERADRPPQGAAAIEPGRRGTPSGELRRANAAQSGDRVVGPGRWRPRRGRAVVHGSGRAKLRPLARPRRDGAAERGRPRSAGSHGGRNPGGASRRQRGFP